MFDIALIGSHILSFVGRNFDPNVCFYLMMGFSYPFSDLLLAALGKRVAMCAGGSGPATQAGCADTGRNGWRFADWQ